MEQREIQAIIRVREVVRDTAKELGLSEDRIIELVKYSASKKETEDLKAYLDSPEVQTNLHPSMQRMSKLVGTLSLEEADSLFIHTKEMRDEWE